MKTTRTDYFAAFMSKKLKSTVKGLLQPPAHMSSPSVFMFVREERFLKKMLKISKNTRRGDFTHESFNSLMNHLPL